MPSAEFNQLLEQLKNIGDQSIISVEELRAASERKGASFPIPEDVTLTPMQNLELKAEYSETPGCSSEHTLMFFHGGGYYRGSIAATRELATRMARECGMRGMNTGYRLAPESTFPAPVEDALNVYSFLLEDGQRPEKVIVAGASAGGGLALALMHAARNVGLPLPGAAILLSPWVDLTQSGPTFQSNAATDPTISKPYLDRFAQMYLGGESATHPLASPINGEMAGLPPMLIQVGGAETMLDESERLAEKAKAAGVDVTLEIWPHMVHVWQGNGAHIPEAREAVEKAGAWAREKMGL